jgi:hypothetical protein
MQDSGIVFSAKKNENNKLLDYISNLTDKRSNSCVTDFALYTPINSIQRFLARYELMKLIKDIPGCVIEMGVCSGNGLMSLVHSHNILEQTYKYREFYGFDTFSGFPSTESNDTSYSSIGDFNNDSYDKIIDLLNIHNSYTYVPANVELIKGDVTKTIQPFLDEHSHIMISLLYLDLDIYAPTKICLEKLLPRMVKGSIIAFDELNYKHFPGETLAMLETIGTKYKFKQLLNSHINYCIIE